MSTTTVTMTAKDATSTKTIADLPHLNRPRFYVRIASPTVTETGMTD